MPFAAAVASRFAPAVLAISAVVASALFTSVWATSPEMVPAAPPANDEQPKMRPSLAKREEPNEQPAMTGEIEKSEKKRAAPQGDKSGVKRASSVPPAETARTAASAGMRLGDGATAAAVAFSPVDFQDLPGWAIDDHLAALKTFLQSCPPLIAAQKAGNKAGRLATPPELIAVCDAAIKLPATMTRSGARAFFEQQFRPYRVVHAAAQGLLTGYYEPLLEGSRKREGRFQWPILRRPTDLVNVVEETQRGTVGTKLTHARMMPGGKLAPYATRAEIVAGALDGQNLELFYLADPVDVFFLQIQGSGRIKLPDGSIARVNYDGKNGHPYTSIGRYLIDNNLLSADKMSMGALGKWLRSDLARGQQVMQQNASYVFFRELTGESTGPLGVLEIPLTTGRSLAVDSSVHTLGAPIYVSAPTLTHALKGAPYQRLMVAQDVGSAIKGPERGDIYFGSGDAAGRIAGITKHPGHLFALKPRTASDQASAIATGSTVPAGDGKARPSKGDAKPAKP